MLTPEDLKDNPIPKETYIGPCTLREALDAAQPDRCGLRLAVSSPNGTLIALGFPDNQVLIREAACMSGQGGSKADTGEWLNPEEVQGFLRGRGQWRPA